MRSAISGRCPIILHPHYIYTPITPPSDELLRLQRTADSQSVTCCWDREVLHWAAVCCNCFAIKCLAFTLVFLLVWDPWITWFPIYPSSPSETRAGCHTLSYIHSIGASSYRRTKLSLCVSWTVVSPLLCTARSTKPMWWRCYDVLCTGEPMW